LLKVYKERVLILNNIFKPVSSTIEYACKINQLVVKLLMQNALSHEILQYCSTCKWMYKDSVTIIEINIKPMYEYGICGLKKALNEKVEAVNKKYRRGNDNILTNFTTGMHLFIDIECLQWTDLIAEGLVILIGLACLLFQTYQ